MKRRTFETVARRNEAARCVMGLQEMGIQLRRRTQIEDAMKYNVILADPPVPYAGWTGYPVEEQYSLMAWDGLKRLGPLIDAVAASDCALFLWVCPPLLVETLDMVQAWGWQYKTKAFTWCKLYPTGSNFFVGMGYWTMANSEDVWLCTRGHPRRRNKDVAQLLATIETETIIAPNVRHSQKPEAIQDRIERLMAGPYLELFARRQRAGWTCIGNELDGLDIRESLARLARNETLPVVQQTIKQEVLL